MLSKLRTKSEQTRRILAVLVALLITAIIIVFWLWSLSGRFAKSRENVGTEVKPFHALVDSISSLFSDYNKTRAEQKAMYAEERAVFDDSALDTDAENVAEDSVVVGEDSQDTQSPDVVEVTSSDTVTGEEVPSTE